MPYTHVLVGIYPTHQRREPFTSTIAAHRALTIMQKAGDGVWHLETL